MGMLITSRNAIGDPIVYKVGGTIHDPNFLFSEINPGASKENILKAYRPNTADKLDAGNYYYWSEFGSKGNAPGITYNRKRTFRYYIYGALDSIRIVNPPVNSDTEAKTKNFCFLEDLQVIKDASSNPKIFTDAADVANRLGIPAVAQTTTIGGDVWYQEFHIGYTN
jgi:hypothetical protein